MMSSDGYWSNSMTRLPEVATCSRPLSVAETRSWLSPRMLIAEAWPPVRCEVTPGRRASDSAIETSGKRPISSAETISATTSRLRLTAIDERRLARKPVTTMSSLDSAAGPLLGAVASCVATVGAGVEGALDTVLSAEAGAGSVATCASATDAAKSATASAVPLADRVKR
ncbi:hypothetical protein SPHINGOT1_20297 [Sphingomonas sp. T1]|nr:hypothetical protein SPHINGOT1_20297 [Sphingomonas sp. T1]